MNRAPHRMFPRTRRWALHRARRSARSCALLAVAAIAALGVVLPAPSTALAAPAAPLRLEDRQNTYPDGTRRTWWQVRRTDAGRELRHGRLLRYHPNGHVAVRGFYRDGEAVGVWRWFDAEGRFLRSARMQGDFEEVLKGRELEQTAIVLRDPQGRKVAEGLRKYAKAHGPWRYYHRDGTLSAEGRFIAGLPHGPWRFYHPSGQIAREETYKLGVPHGRLIHGYPTGQERLEGRLEQGLRVGRWRTWHPNGQVESDGVYREDRRDGAWRFWDAEGRLTAHVRYAGGRIVAELPLPHEEAARRRVIPEPELLPFRPRIYDESGTEIRLREQ